MTAPQHHARRRYLRKDIPTTITPTVASLRVLDTQDACQKDSNATSLQLRKSSTFHSPTSPPSQEDDPILNIPLLPRRSPTCPKDLEDAVAAGEKRVAQVIGVVDRSLSGLENFSTDSQETLRAEDLPVPRFMIDAHVGEFDEMDIDKPADHEPHLQRYQHVPHKHHASDSGIGSTVTDSEESLSGNSAVHIKRETNEIPCAIHEIQSGINGNTISSAALKPGIQHALSEYACRQIQKHIILPIVQESSLKNFHPLVTGIPYRVGRKEITCLRDLEKVLLWRAPCIHTTVEYLNESDQRRPADRPYTNGYFLDLTEQVRQYAAMITASREQMAAGREPAENGYTRDERVRLEGGLSQTGRPAELVRLKNGESISLRTGAAVQPESKDLDSRLKRSASVESDNDVMRSMARRRKSAQPAVKDVQRCSDCDKVFRRPCDLTKHEKTHSRPWKCSESSCKYHQFGWPTEKERDRHVNDKHSTTPSMYKCQYHPCPYESKRESNCKQHMEKAHGFAYIRSKNNGKTARKAPSVKTPPTPQITTPGSYTFDVSGSECGEASNSRNTLNVAHSVSGSIAASEESASVSNVETPFMAVDEPFGHLDPPFSWNESYHRLPVAGSSEYTPSTHSQSWDASTNALAMPSSFETSLASDDRDPLFSDNFDWSNMNNLTYNIQLITPACSVESKPLDAFSRNPSVSLDQPLSDHIPIPSLSPGAHGNLMLYSPYSSNDAAVDEAYDDFDTEKPASDFALFDRSSHTTSSMISTGNENMFQDLDSIAPTGWSGRGTDLANQFGMNDLMQVDDE
ncbi:copper-binding transcription factor [Pseudocyphellaria aurata]|nr:copper-binding transcription factor [Pseudocyphellaria aurata]